MSSLQEKFNGRPGLDSFYGGRYKTYCVYSKCFDLQYFIDILVGLEEDVVRARGAGSEPEGEDIVALEGGVLEVSGGQLFRHFASKIVTSLILRISHVFVDIP